MTKNISPNYTVVLMVDASSQLFYPGEFLLLFFFNLWARRLSGLLLLSYVQLFETLWTVSCQSPLPIGFPRQEYWSGLPFPPQEDFPDPGIKPMSPALVGDYLCTALPGKPDFNLY